MRGPSSTPTPVDSCGSVGDDARSELDVDAVARHVDRPVRAGPRNPQHRLVVGQRRSLVDDCQFVVVEVEQVGCGRHASAGADALGLVDPDL